MIGRDELGRAALDNDSRAKDKHGIRSIVASLNLDPDGVVYVARQRALRAVLSERGPSWQQRMTDAMYAKEELDFQLDSREQQRLVAYSAVWLDGIVIGMQALKSQET